MGFANLIGLIIIIIIFWLLRTIREVEFVQRFLIFLILNTTLWDVLLVIGPRIFLLMIYWIMFHWLTKAFVRPKEAFWGATITSILNELNWYLGNQWVRYKLIYGSLGRIIAQLLWIHFSSYVILFGAHISSVLRKHPDKEHVLIELFFKMN